MKHRRHRRPGYNAGGMHITDDQLDRYRRQGFLIIENFLTEQERAAAMDGFFSRFAPPYEDYVAAGRNNLTPRQGLFPWTTPVSTTSPSIRISSPPPNGCSVRARSGWTRATWA